LNAELARADGDDFEGRQRARAGDQSDEETSGVLGESVDGSGQGV